MDGLTSEGANRGRGLFRIRPDGEGEVCPIDVDSAVLGAVLAFFFENEADGARENDVVTVFDVLLDHLGPLAIKASINEGGVLATTAATANTELNRIASVALFKLGGTSNVTSSRKRKHDFR